MQGYTVWIAGIHTSFGQQQMKFQSHTSPLSVAKALAEFLSLGKCATRMQRQHKANLPQPGKLLKKARELKQLTIRRLKVLVLGHPN